MIELKNVNFAYAGGREGGVRDINLAVAPGECIVLCGRSGCGKTTLTRLINGLIPHFYEGELTGEIRLGALEPSRSTLPKIAGLVGSVFQNPRSQFFNVDTTGELAFGCENQGLEPVQIRERIGEAARRFAIPHLLNRSIFELSGGEKQRIACAAAYATGPAVYVFDEPSANLDAPAVENLRQVLAELKAAGKTIVISEHRLYYLADLADRFVHLEAGRIERIVPGSLMRRTENSELNRRGLRCLNYAGLAGSKGHGAADEIGLEIRDLTCVYAWRTALSIPKLMLSRGEVLGVVGPNGAGKSTFAGCLCGITKHKGKISAAGRLLKPKERIRAGYMVMQDVNHQLFTESVAEEITLGAPPNDGMAPEELLAQLDLAHAMDDHPLSLSGGEKQRVAVAGAVYAGKEILIYDEPTSGLDYLSMQATCRLIDQAGKKALASIVISHDLEFLLSCCTAILHLEAGEVADYYPLDDGGCEKLKTFFLGESDGLDLVAGVVV